MSKFSIFHRLSCGLGIHTPKDLGLVNIRTCIPHTIDSHNNMLWLRFNTFGFTFREISCACGRQTFTIEKVVKRPGGEINLSLTAAKTDTEFMAFFEKIAHIEHVLKMGMCWVRNDKFTPIPLKELQQYKNAANGLETPAAYAFKAALFDYDYVAKTIYWWFNYGRTIQEKRRAETLNTP